MPITSEEITEISQVLLGRDVSLSELAQICGASHFSDRSSLRAAILCSDAFQVRHGIYHSLDYRLAQTDLTLSSIASEILQNTQRLEALQRDRAAVGVEFAGIVRAIEDCSKKLSHLDNEISSLVSDLNVLRLGLNGAETND